MQYRPDQTLHGAAPIMSSMLFTSAFQIQKGDGLSDMFSMQKIHPHPIIFIRRLQSPVPLEARQQLPQRLLKPFVHCPR